VCIRPVPSIFAFTVLCNSLVGWFCVVVDDESCGCESAHCGRLRGASILYQGKGADQILAIVYKYNAVRTGTQADEEQRAADL
jgi:hypothetical protein